MRVAAYQAPLLAPGSLEVIELIREQVGRCESAGVEILCCPEAVLGGLADYAPQPITFGINLKRDELSKVLAPLASDTVTTVIGFTEIDQSSLCNSAAVFHKGLVGGVYRKLHPAINKSVYEPGDEIPVFTVGELTFGVIICRDSNFMEPAQTMAAKGAAALFIPTNNGLPPAKTGPEIVDDARNIDITLAKENGVSIVRADVAGRSADLVAYGSSGIVGPDGVVLAAANQLEVELIVADIETACRVNPLN